MSRQDEVAPSGQWGGFRWQTAVAVLAAVLGLIWILQNFQAVEVQFLFLTVSIWLWLLLLLMFVLGALFGSTVWDLIRRRGRRGGPSA